MAFLVAVSFIIHIVVVFILVSLKNRIAHLEQENEKLNHLKVEIQDSLILHTSQIKKDNEALIQSLSNHTVTSEEQKSKRSNVELAESAQSGAVQHKSIEQEPLKESPKKSSFKAELNKAEASSYSDYEPPVDTTSEGVVFEQSLTVKVLTLSKQGLSVEEIAKQLKVGKGEVQLILNFYR
ncbi:hypothetical protein AJ85_05205 [Alkalihalobacillus alcalophilus ATCC 27647 = CGMCC 1.3604]|uniref:Swarming motility protein SwrB n=1 Tax=Alkalihalobacillus alcalophilus ATCC 27647 = CGMCC 1.3604 TaxID=1218173 RepID=A0A094WKH6_ALKAL|nr:hypothetical protein [Alkalihalobacillus alcalophilus]KGA98224.1 hypothetical protein BALCAV_0205530 [Alkalihalobacillus alcalophilus ATCC 27647 = CGMCC 1.3604]MED1562164.1 hypothetical protein [Alkalihalobacillus alcalophilus]THG91389.1 hypothetical protein AJ85_05205 [Alkalihalobacillus alcalophilus ATCC 27647 = CGMCC 1.3604]